MSKKCIHETTGKRGKECACLTKMLCRTGECSFCRPEGKYLYNKDKDDEGRVVGVEAIHAIQHYRTPLKIKKVKTAEDQIKAWEKDYKTAAEFKEFFAEEWPKTCAMIKEALAATRA